MGKNKVIIFVLIIAIWAVLFFWNDLAGIYTKVFSQLPQVEENISGIIQETGKQIFVPPPLRSEKENENSSLTKDGVIRQTNLQRAKYGLPELKENSILDESAAKKVEDMFLNQYFAHESLSGLGVKDLAESEGYQFIVIGENLALGNFENDQTLVQAWMDSPGHRANILNEDFQEIGVFVLKGVFEGKTTWLAVQHFGKPLSSCPQPDASLKLRIDSSRNELSALQVSLDGLKAELQSREQKSRESYNQKVEQYNTFIVQYNSISDNLKAMIDEYNLQVKSFNSCAGGA
jgi:uncharacterized protein YkwD